jgi:hypothetical protein
MLRTAQYACAAGFLTLALRAAAYAWKPSTAAGLTGFSVWLLCDYGIDSNVIKLCSSTIEFGAAGGSL